MPDDDFDDVRSLGAELTPEDFERHPPPPGTWDAIAAGLGDGDPARDDDSASPSPDTSGGARVIPLERNRRRRVARSVLAVAAGVLLVVGVVGVLASGSDGDDALTEVALSDDGLQVAAPDDGNATLVETDDGLFIDLELPGLPDGDFFYEAWLIDIEVDGMFSFGAVDGDGRVKVPAGVDPGEYPVVDISVEATDGDPTHSGRSVLRGVFEI